MKYPAISSSSVSITLDGLAGNSQGVFTSGRASATISNNSTLDLDHLLSGFVRVGNSAGTDGRSINIYATAPISLVSGTPVWAPSFSGSDAGVSGLQAGSMHAYLRLLLSITVTASASTTYHFSGISVASAFGGLLPPMYVLYVSHDTTNGGLSNDSGANAINYTRVQGQSV